MPYQMEKPEGKTARAFGNELRTSWKNAINVARAIQGMPVRKAEAYLEEVIALKRPVPFTTRNLKVAHKPGIGPGRYPKKSATETLEVLRNAINNAEYQGHDPDEMVIFHASAYKGRTIKAYMPRAQGRATAKNEDTTNIEIILLEKKEEAEERKETRKAAPKRAATPKAEKAEAEKPETKTEKPTTKAAATHAAVPKEAKK